MGSDLGPWSGYPTLLIGGAGGLAREMAVLARGIAEPGTIRLVRADEELDVVPNASGAAVLGVGDPSIRARMWNHWHSLNPDLLWPRLVHASVDIADSETVELDEGVVLTSGVVMTCDISVGTGSLVNWNVTVGHDARVGKFCVLNPGAAISGRARIGDRVLVGVNATVLEGRSIGDGAVIGAGAVVTKDVPPGQTWVGVPARPIESLA